MSVLELARYLNEKVINKFFTATSSRLGGIGLKIIAKETLMRHDFAFNKNQNNILDEGGFYHWRETGELHQWNPNLEHNFLLRVRVTEL